MAKLTLTDVANISGSETSAIAAINSNNSALETALENTLSRDGTSPNAMNNDFDMNGYDIINAGLINGQDANDLVGPEGPQGPQGDTGATGATGPKGDTGATGATGAAATIAVGTVTTGSAGSSVIINNTGSSSAAVFDFTIPRGDTGASGSGTGDVIGPASATDSAVVLYDGTTGKLIKDSAKAVPAGTIVGTSDTQSLTNKKLGSLTTNGFVKTSAGDGTLSVDTTSYQTLDSDLTTIAGLTATTDNFIQSKSSAWASRTPTQVTADLIAVVGDSGSGGTKGLVPAPAAGDTAAGKFLKANGTWAAPSGSGGSSSNDYLAWMYQSKSFAGYRRGIELFADGYKASDGVNSGSSSNYTVNTTSGYVGPTQPPAGVVSVLHFDGTNASTTITDSQPGSTHTWTCNGNAQLSTSSPQFGTAAALFDGTGDYISSDSSTDFDFQAAGDWTIEFWVKPTSVAAGTDAFIYSGASGGGANLQISRNATSIVIDNGSVGSISASAGFTTGWQHVAVCRESGTIRAYVGGVQKASAAAQTYTGGARVLTIGRYNAGASGVSDLNGRIDDLRVTKGTAVYPGGTTFTPPAAAFLTTPANATIVSTLQTADASVSNGRVLLEIDPIDSITLNTDLTVEVTCNGGTNYTTCTLTSLGKGQAGRTVVDTGVQVIANSGTSFATRIKTLNNKSVNIYGTTLEVS